MIVTNQLTKKYRCFTAVNDVNIRIQKGHIYGLLGPNGAGKSTVMKMLLGLVKPTRGSFQVNGMTMPRDRARILSNTGSLIEAPAFYGNLTGYENLDIVRKILGLPQSSIDEALDLVRLTEYKDRLAKQYSLGMKQRLGLASAMLGNPPILILDEPTNGLDPTGMHEIRNLIRSLPKRFGSTVLISSHILSEVELMVDDVGVLNHGRLLFQGTMKELKGLAHAKGYGNERLEDMFLSMVEADNRARKERAVL
jgi:ABC-type multidrug transport system ATPase subunit